MKKKTKVSLIITGIVVLLLLILFSLIYFKVIYNPFVNNKDLVCVRSYTDSKEEIIFKFNWKAEAIFSKEVNYIYFETEESAQSYYDFYIKQTLGNMRIDGKVVISDSGTENEKENYGELRKEINKK